MSTPTEQLAALRTELEAELKTIATQHPESGDWIAIPPTDEIAEADPNSEADSTEEWNERRAVLASLEQRWRNIVRAEEKVVSGTYGICELSGAPIEPERLAANPAARTCIAERNNENQLPQ
jgi:DnaK suppressor protein